MQFTHEYVQKSTRTTLPRRPCSESGRAPGVLIHFVIPVKSGAGPKFLSVSGELPAATAAGAFPADAVRWRRSPLIEWARSTRWIDDT